MQFNFDNRISLEEFCNENSLKNQENMKYDSFGTESGFCFWKEQKLLHSNTHIDKTKMMPCLPV